MFLIIVCEADLEVLMLFVRPLVRPSVRRNIENKGLMT